MSYTYTLSGSSKNLDQTITVYSILTYASSETCRRLDLKASNIPGPLSRRLTPVKYRRAKGTKSRLSGWVGPWGLLTVGGLARSQWESLKRPLELTPDTVLGSSPLPPFFSISVLIFPSISWVIFLDSSQFEAIVLGPYHHSTYLNYEW